MNTVTKLLKNTIYLTLAEVSAPLISVLLVVYISRLLGTEGLGEYSTITAFLFFFEKLAQLGLHHLIVRDVAANKSQAGVFLTTAIVIGVASSLLALGVLYVILQVMAYPASINAGIGLLSLSLVFFVLTDYAQSFLEGMQRMELRSLATILEAVFRVGLGILAISLGYGLIGLIGALLLTRVLICALYFFMLFRAGIRPAKQFDRRLALTLVKQTVTFLLTSVITTTYWKIDVIMLSKMKGTDQAGYYSAAYRLMEILKGLSYSYISALFPLLASSFAASRESFQRKCALSIRYLFMLTFPISLGVTVLADPIIALIYGREFAASATMLRGLIWTICLFPLAMIYARALVASKNQRLDLACNAIAMLMNVGLNLALIPRYSQLGAVIATLISIVVFLLAQQYFVSRLLFTIPLSSALLKTLFAGAFMGAFTYVLREQNLFLVIAASGVVYLGLLLLMNTFSAEEKDMFRTVWQQKAKLVTLRG